MKFTLYTDGSCYPNPGPGGWAYLIYARDGWHTSESGSRQKTTNNRMEMTAVINGLHAILNASLNPDRDEVVIHSDSMYVVKGINEWRTKWRLTGWQVKNPLLWMTIDNACREFKQVTAVHVRGHSGNELNEEVDRLAMMARTGGRYD